MEIRALRETDVRGGFQSGDLDLDRFFAKYAGQNQFRHYVGVTYVAIDGQRILGYTTVAAAQIEGGELTKALRRKLPAYPLPVLRLARLAVDQRSQKQGVGRSLLRHVFVLSLKMAEEYGCVGVVVDAMAAARGFYARLGFTELSLEGGQMESRPEPIVMFLPLDLIRRAIISRDH